MDQEALEAERLDADIEQANLAADGNRISALERRGICSHGWRLLNGYRRSQEQIDEHRTGGRFPDRPTNYTPPPQGYDLCLDCGQHVPSLR